MPAPEDHGPLQPGELEELRAFVEENLPNLHVLLERLEQRGTPSVRKHFHRLAPLLRQLRRIYHQNPEMAQLLASHAENLFGLEGLRRSWVRATAEEREPLEQQARSYVAANLRIQIAALELWADQLEQTRAERVAERLALVTGPDADLAVEAPPVRRLVEQICREEDETRQVALTEELTALLTTQLEGRIAALRTRAAEMNDSLSEEVDRRLEWFRSGRPPRSPRP